MNSYQKCALVAIFHLQKQNHICFFSIPFSPTAGFIFPLRFLAYILCLIYNCTPLFYTYSVIGVGLAQYALVDTMPPTSYLGIGCTQPISERNMSSH